MENTALPIAAVATNLTTHHALTRLLYDRLSAARELGISPRTLDSMIARRELTFRRIGTRVLIPANEIYRLTTGTATGVALAGWPSAGWSQRVSSQSPHAALTT